MHRDFLTAIWNNEDTGAVYDRLRDGIDAAHRQAISKLWRDKDVCDKVNAALREPVDSTMYQWARAYLDEAQKREERKTDPQLAYEAQRRELEAEYLKLKKQEVDEMRQHHSER